MVAHDISRLDAFVASSCRQGLRVDGHWAIRCAQAGLGTRGVSAVGSGTLRSLQPVDGCSRISKLVLRAAGRTDALRTLVTPLSHGTDSWRGGMADQLS